MLSASAPSPTKRIELSLICMHGQPTAVEDSEAAKLQTVTGFTSDPKDPRRARGGPGQINLFAMRRFYLNNDSYPELRGIDPRWARTVTWWRAIRRAGRHGDFWGFVATQLGALLALIVLDVAILAAAGWRGGPARLTHIVLGGVAMAVSLATSRSRAEAT